MQRGIFFPLRRLGRKCFTNFVPQGVLKMADDLTGSVRDVYFEVLHVPIDERFLVWLSIDRYQLSNFID